MIGKVRKIEWRRVQVLGSIGKQNLVGVIVTQCWTKRVSFINDKLEGNTDTRHTKVYTCLLVRFLSRYARVEKYLQSWSRFACSMKLEWNERTNETRTRIKKKYIYIYTGWIMKGSGKIVGDGMDVCMKIIISLREKKRKTKFQKINV